MPSNLNPGLQASELTVSYNMNASNVAASPSDGPSFMDHSSNANIDISSHEALRLLPLLQPLHAATGASMTFVWGATSGVAGGVIHGNPQALPAVGTARQDRSLGVRITGNARQVRSAFEMITSLID